MTDNDSAFHSGEYDTKILQTVPYYQEFYKNVIDLLKVHKAEDLAWLDVGCGTGKMAELAFSEMDIKRFVFVDLSESMIKIAKQRFSGIKSEFNVCNILDMPYIEEFDVVTAVQVNHYFHKQQKIDVLKKYYSALKYKGIYIGFENFMPYTKYGVWLGLEKWKSYQLCQGKSLEECQNHMSRFGVEYFPITVSEHLEILNLAGFETAEILWLSNLQVGVYGIKS